MEKYSTAENIAELAFVRFAVKTFSPDCKTVHKHGKAILEFEKLSEPSRWLRLYFYQKKFTDTLEMIVKKLPYRKRE